KRHDVSALPVQREPDSQGEVNYEPEQGREAQPGRRGHQEQVPPEPEAGVVKRRRERRRNTSKTAGNRRMSSNTLPRPAGLHQGRFGPRGAAPCSGAISELI